MTRYKQEILTLAMGSAHGWVAFLTFWAAWNFMLDGAALFCALFGLLALFAGREFRHSILSAGHWRRARLARQVRDAD